MKTNTAIIVVVLLVILLGVWYWAMKNKDMGEEVPMSEGLTENREDYNENTQGVKEASNIQESSNQIISEENNKKMTATLKTSMGEIVIEFYTSTPKTVENFVKLAKDGFYDGTKFHRVIKGFMSQGGDPLSKDDSKMNLWGTGGPGYKFEDEISTDNKNDKFTISMANAGPNTNGSQFFINATNNNFLDTKHTVFGKVIKGQEVADAINNVATGPNDRPATPVVLEKVTIN